MYPPAGVGDAALLYDGDEAELFAKRTFYIRGGTQRGREGEKLRAGRCGQVGRNEGSLIFERRKGGGVEECRDVGLFRR